VRRERCAAFTGHPPACFECRTHSGHGVRPWRNTVSEHGTTQRELTKGVVGGSDAAVNVGLAQSDGEGI
jgi:hypothetical protein